MGDFIVAKELVRYSRSQKSEVRSQKSEVRSQKSEVRSQKSAVRSQKSEVRSQKSEVSLKYGIDLWSPYAMFLWIFACDRIFGFLRSQKSKGREPKELKKSGY
ncbi:MAG: hypothetical protein F6K55_32990 [Moorea sp. SIO4A3]|nr:hypothetical protein [Moorena sp. SIO4A3]